MVLICKELFSKVTEYLDFIVILHVDVCVCSMCVHMNVCMCVYLHMCIAMCGGLKMMSVHLDCFPLYLLRLGYLLKLELTTSGQPC